MKLRTIVAISAALMVATPVLAQPRHDDHRGGPPHGGQQWRKGQRLPKQYWGRDREVTDWRARHLRQPPRGYHWVRDDSGNFILAGIAGGLIASIIAGAN
jgi:Ni/Co efflux regulator RcnB